MSATTAERPTPEDLMNAAQQLDGPELDQLSDRLLLLRAERRAPHVPEEESDLLLKITTGLPEKTWQRYSRLHAKLRANKINAKEHEELLRLINVVEIDNAARIGNLIELARIRQTTFDEVMRSLGIGPRAHV